MNSREINIMGHVKKLFFVLLAAVGFTLLMSVSSVRAEIRIKFNSSDSAEIWISGEGTVYADDLTAAGVDKTELKYVGIANTVKGIGDDVFYGCTKLKSVVFQNTSSGGSSSNVGTTPSVESSPSSVERIGDRAFSGCTSLESIDIPNSVTSIGESAFYGCTGLKSVTLSNNITTIAQSIFYNCTSLGSITIPNSVKSIGIDAFSGCTSLTSVTKPDSVTLSDGSKMNTLPDSVTSIGTRAFSGCTSLKSITIPNSVKLMGAAVFINCTSLSSIILPTNSAFTSIGSSVFYGCTSLESITIPNSVQSIGSNVFSRCTSLKSITLPDSVTSIDTYAFSGCTSLSSIILPANSNFTSIGDSAFRGCTSLKSITIPRTVTSMGEYVFTDCYSLDSIEFKAKPENTTLTVSSSVFPSNAYIVSGTGVSATASPITGNLEIDSRNNVTVKILFSLTRAKKLDDGASESITVVPADGQYNLANNAAVLLVPRMSSVSLTAPDQSGYDFLGWFRAGDSSNARLCKDKTYTFIIRSDANYEARYVSSSKRVAIFEVYDVLTHEPIAETATQIVMPAAPVADYGWEFTGWKCEGQDGLITDDTYTIPNSITGNITFTAQFEPIKGTVNVTTNTGLSDATGDKNIGWIAVRPIEPEGFHHWEQKIGNRLLVSYIQESTFWVAEDCTISAKDDGDALDTPQATAALMYYSKSTDQVRDDLFTFFITAPGEIKEIGVLAVPEVVTDFLTLYNATSYVRNVVVSDENQFRTLNWRATPLGAAWTVRPYVIYEGTDATITTYGDQTNSSIFKA